MDIAEKVFSKILIQELRSMNVATYKIISANPERDAVIYIKNLLERKGFDFYDLRKFGVDIPVSEAQQNIGLRGYEWWVCLPDDIKKIDGVTIKTIPASNYAVLRIKKPFDTSFDTISNGWLELHNWTLTSGYKTAIHDPNRYLLEELIKIDGVIYLDLFYPVCMYEYAN